MQAGDQTFPPAHLPPLAGPAPPVRPPLPLAGAAGRSLGGLGPRAQAQVQARLGHWGSGLRGAGFWGWPGGRQGLLPFRQLQLCLPAAHHLGVAAGVQGLWRPGITGRELAKPPLRRPSRSPLQETASPYPMGREDQPPLHPIGATKRHFRCSAPRFTRASARKTSAPPLSRSFGTSARGSPTGPHEDHSSSGNLDVASLSCSLYLTSAGVHTVSVNPFCRGAKWTALGQEAPHRSPLVSASAASPGVLRTGTGASQYE